MKPTISESLASFDALPASAHVRQPVVEALYSCSPATVWRWVNAGLIPKPKKLGPRLTAWNVGELRAAQRSRDAESGPAPAPVTKRRAPLI